MTEPRQTRWSRLRREAGKCFCGKRTNGYSLCQHHLCVQNARMRQRRKEGKLPPVRFHVQADGCWIPTGDAIKNRLGYFTLFVDGSPILGHRYSYQTFVGPIPRGLVIDHLCRNRSCCNPEHLQAVTHKENMRRTRDPLFCAPQRRITDTWTNSFRYASTCPISNLPIFVFDGGAR